MKYTNTTAYVVALGVSVALAGCGGSSQSPPTNTNPSAADPAIAVSVVGQIDAFGSVFVNGIEFETGSATYRVDDEDAFDDSSLSVGMIVKVEGSVRSDGTGEAISVEYDDELEGLVADLAEDPMDAAKKLFTIFGIAVVVDASTTVFKAEDDADFSFETLADGDHVEVSGEYQENTLLATYIKKEDSLDEDFEAKGTVSDYMGGDTFTLTLANGGTLEVMLAAGAEIPDSGIRNEQYVEIEGTIPDPVAAPTVFLATKVEVEDHDDFDGDDNEVEIEGVLSFDGTDWSIRTNTLAFDDATEYRPTMLEDAIADGSAAGRRAEVHGHVMADVLFVEEIEVEDDDLEIKGIVESIDPPDATNEGILTLSFSPATGTIPVAVNTETMLKNDDSMNPFDLSNLSPGMSYVEIKGHSDGAGGVVAGMLELEEHVGGYEIEGPLDDDGFVADVSISVLGVTFSLDMDTELEDGEPLVGDFIEVKDENRDGTVESIDVHD